MIDYAKIEFYLLSSILKNLIDAGMLKEHETKKDNYKWYNFEICVRRKDGVVILSGSLHKLYNHVFLKNGYANFSDYSYNHLIRTVQLITDTFKLDPLITPIRSIEFGVNIIPPIKSNRLIVAAQTLKNIPPEVRFSGGFKIFKLQRYGFKFYDKGSQYRKDFSGTEEERLRMEIHVDRMIHLEPFGIRYLVDILMIDKMLLLCEPLVQAIDEIQFFPGLYTFPKLTLPEQKLIEKLKDSVHISDLAVSNRPKLNYYNRAFDALLVKYNIQDYRKILSDQVSKKWKELCQTDPKTSTKLTGYLRQFPQYHEEVFHQHLKGQNFNRINRSNTGLIELNKPIINEVIPNMIKTSHCLSCGKPLPSWQKEGSKFCSAKDVGISAAHRCRNIMTNPRHNNRRSRELLMAKIAKLNTGMFLFDQRPFIKQPSTQTSFQD